MARVDVIVPCFNYGRFLQSCVETVLRQQTVDVRVLIIDDASSDNTPLVARQLASEDRRVVFRRHTVNRGNIATYNEGIDWADGDYLLLLSADDCLLPGALTRAVAILAAHPEVVMAYGPAAVIYEGRSIDRMQPRRESLSYTIVEGRKFIANACVNSSTSPVWTPTAVVRTSAQKTAGGYNAKLPHAGDVEMWLRLARLGSIAVLSCHQALYRRHSSNMHYAYAGVANLRQQLLAFDSGLAADLPNRAVLERTYRRGLAVGAIRAANHALNENDAAGFHEAVVFATEVFPRIRYTLPWQSMKLRRRLGHRIVNSLRRTLRPVSASLRER